MTTSLLSRRGKMEHKLRATLFNNELLIFCSCSNLIRLRTLGDPGEDLELSFKIHKQAWEEMEEAKCSGSAQSD